MFRSLFALILTALLAPQALAGQSDAPLLAFGSSTAGPRRRPSGRSGCASCCWRMAA